MTDGSGFVLGLAALFVNVVTTILILIRLRANPDAYEGTFESFDASVKQVTVRGVLLAVLLAVLFLIAGPNASTVGLGSESFTPTFVAVGLVVGFALVLTSVASGAVVDRLGWETDSAAWTTLWPDSPREWALYLPASVLSTTVDATLYIAFVVGGWTTGTTPTAFALAGVSAIFVGVKGAWEGPGIVVRTTVTFLVLGVAFVLTRSWLVLVVALSVNSIVHGLQDNAEARYGSAAAAD